MRNIRNDGEHDDNQVVAWMRDADPVSDLAPLPSWQLERLKETAMTTPTTTPAPVKSRRRLITVAGISAAAAAAIIGGVLIAGPNTTPGGGAVTALSVPDAGGPAAMCAEVTPQALESSTLAFRGTVTSIRDGLVTFRVDEVFTGDLEQAVTVPQGDPDTQVDGAAPVFQDGTTYLVSTTDDVIRTCGQTGEETAALDTLYSQAF